MLLPGTCGIVGAVGHHQGTFACHAGRVVTAMRDDDDGTSSIHEIDSLECCTVRLQSPPITRKINANRDMGSAEAYSPWNIRCPDGYILGGWSVCLTAL